MPIGLLYDRDGRPNSVVIKASYNETALFLEYNGSITRSETGDRYLSDEGFDGHNTKGRILESYETDLEPLFQAIFEAIEQHYFKEE